MKNKIINSKFSKKCGNNDGWQNFNVSYLMTAWDHSLIQHRCCCHLCAPQRWTSGPFWAYRHRRQNFTIHSTASISYELFSYSAGFYFSPPCPAVKKSDPKVWQLSVHLGTLFALVFLFSWTPDTKKEILFCHGYFPLDLCCYNTKL